MTIRERLKSLVTHNLGLKLTSIAGAIMMFSVVRGAEDAQRSVFVDVVAILPPPSAGRMLVSELPDRVRLTFKGSRVQLNAIQPELLPSVEIDLTDTSVPYYYFADDEFEVPPGIQITQVAPASIQLRWAERIERTLRVQADIQGEPPEGSVLAEPPSVRPQEVRLVGPAELVSSLRVARTQPVSLDNIDLGRHTRRVPLASLPEHVRALNNAPIAVELHIVEDLTERTLPGVSVTFEGGEATSETGAVTFTLRGPPSSVDLIDPASLAAIADVSGLPEDGGSIALVARGVPAGVEVLSIEPSHVDATSASE